MADTIETLKRNISTNASALQTQAQSAASNAVDISRTELDKRFPPEQRADVAHSVKGWIAQHPALFYFLALQSLLTLPPLLIFLLAASTFLLTTLSALIFLVVSTALFVTFFVIGGMLMVLAPVLFFTVTTATVLFVMGSVALWVLRRFAETETPVPFAEGMLRRVGRVQEVVTGEQGGQSTRSDVDVKRENGHREQDVKVNGELRAKEPVMG